MAVFEKFLWTKHRLPSQGHFLSIEFLEKLPVRSGKRLPGHEVLKFTPVWAHHGSTVWYYGVEQMGLVHP